MQVTHLLFENPRAERHLQQIFDKKQCLKQPWLGHSIDTMSYETVCRPDVCRRNVFRLKDVVIDVPIVESVPDANERSISSWVVAKGHLISIRHLQAKLRSFWKKNNHTNKAVHKKSYFFQLSLILGKLGCFVFKNALKVLPMPNIQKANGAFRK